MFCRSSRTFVDSHPDLAVAWAECKVPTWMLWWLTAYIHMDRGEFAGLADDVDKMWYAPSRFMYTQTDERPEVCDFIRSRVTYWGQLRAVWWAV